MRKFLKSIWKIVREPLLVSATVILRKASARIERSAADSTSNQERID